MSETFSANDESLVWKENGRRELLRTVVFTVNETDSTGPNGETGHYVVADAPDWCIVIPEMDGDFLMVKQWRHASCSLSVEFPGGVIEKGEEPAHAAARELLEETGFSAENLVLLGEMSPNPALFSNRVFVFWAENLSKKGAQSLDSDEFVAYTRIAKKSVLDKMGTAEQSHALMASALCLYMKNHQIF